MDSTSSSPKDTCVDREVVWFALLHGMAPVFFAPRKGRLRACKQEKDGQKWLEDNMHVRLGRRIQCRSGRALI
eukprot:46521-Pelagomonas_calceolata.AAC.2